MTIASNLSKERAPLLLVFGPLAGRVAAIVRVRPTLVTKIAFAPREAIHAIAAFLYISSQAAGSDNEVANLIERHDPRDLLNMALPNCPARLYRALDRAGDTVHERSFYMRLGSICTGPFASGFLDGDLKTTRLDFYEAMQGMDPLTVRLGTALPTPRYWAAVPELHCACCTIRYKLLV
jgi:hypothetical protein